MRIRRLFASAVLVGGMLVAMPGVVGVAHAADTTKSELTECLEKASKEATDSDVNAAAQDCYKAPNLVTPAVSEIIWGAAAFLIVLFVLVKFAFPALKKGMAAREERIRGDLERAESARVEAETQLAEYQRQLAEARAEAGRIIEEARQAADQVRQDLLAKAEADAAEARTRAQEDIRLGDRAGDGRPAEPGRRPVDRAGREGRGEEPRPRDPDPADRELHQPGREQAEPIEP